MSTTELLEALMLVVAVTVEMGKKEEGKHGVTTLMKLIHL